MEQTRWRCRRRFGHLLWNLLRDLLADFMRWFLDGVRRGRERTHSRREGLQQGGDFSRLALWRTGFFGVDLLSGNLRNNFDEPVQNRLVGLRETPRMWRENLQQADHAKIGRDGSRHERTYAQCATDFGIDTGIVCRILARDEQAATNAFSRQALFCVDGSSERRRA